MIDVSDFFFGFSVYAHHHTVANVRHALSLSSCNCLRRRLGILIYPEAEAAQHHGLRVYVIQMTCYRLRGRPEVYPPPSLLPSSFT